MDVGISSVNNDSCLFPLQGGGLGKGLNMVLKLKNFEIGGDKLTILAGPCAIESMDVMRKTAEGLKSVCEKLDINYVFKSSYDKANRSSINSYRGVGMEKGLEMLAQIKKEFDLPIVTDIHTPDQAEVAAEVVEAPTTEGESEA